MYAIETRKQQVASLQGEPLVTTEGRYVVVATLVRDADEALAEWQAIIDAHKLVIASMGRSQLALPATIKA